MDYVSLDGWDQACPCMHKEGFKTLISQKLMEVCLFCAYGFISIKATNWSCNFRWAQLGMPMHAQWGFWNLYISKAVRAPKLIFGQLPLGESDHFTLCIDF